MLDTSARLLRLLALLQARRFWPGPELAERLDVTERTIRRDVDRLRSLGYPVESSSGVAGGYALGVGASLPPLLLEDDEALAVTLGLRTATMGSVAGIEEAALRALTKVEQVLPSRLRRRVKALGEAVSPLYFGSARVDATRLSVIAGASRDFERAAFRYSDTKGHVTERLVEPHGLVHTGSRWYLVAWDETREDWRTFRVDRIEGDVKLRGPFSPRPLPEGDLARYVARSFTEHAYTHVARVIFHAPIERLRSRIAPTVGRLEPVDANRCRLVSGAHTLEVLALHVALLGEDFVIEEPPELVETARALSKRLAHAAKGRGSTRARKHAERELAVTKRETKRAQPKRVSKRAEQTSVEPKRTEPKRESKRAESKRTESKRTESKRTESKRTESKRTESKRAESKRG